MTILDGHEKADVLPNEHRNYLNDYGDALVEAAVKPQREGGHAIRDLIGIIMHDGDEETAGVAVLAEVVVELLEAVDDSQRRGMELFLLRPAPATHLRAIAWTTNGIACFRLDCVPLGQRGIEA